MTFTELSKLMVAYGLTPNEARVVACMRECKVVSHFQLASLLGKAEKAEEDWDGFNNSMRVMIHKIRHKVGKGVVNNIWGFGYEMKPDAKMLEVLP